MVTFVGEQKKKLKESDQKGRAFDMEMELLSNVEYRVNKDVYK